MQILPQQVMGYDRAITVFSPDGRLLQVEYAEKAVGKGAMTMGILCKDGILLIADRRLLDKLIVPESVTKIMQIDDHIIATFSGFTSDARVLIKKCRVFAKQHELTYGEKIDVEGLVRYVADLAQAFTQYAGIRPFGISLLVAGIDKKGLHLFVTEPSGVYSKYYAKAIGMGSTEANLLLEKKYKRDLKIADALKLAISIYKEVLGKEFDINRLEGMVIDHKGARKIKL